MVEEVRFDNSTSKDAVNVRQEEMMAQSAVFKNKQTPQFKSDE